ncbi:hypothetical protein [Mycobacterium sp. E802]|uniref:hypothetical protein n=1 Tax=Mycobacterium sp. E802 TaxID=1834152 RepID=UPI000B19762F|nr:hypothetical protein [Mycobacterium sp. E802]
MTTTTAQGVRDEWSRLAEWWFSLSHGVRLGSRWALIVVLTAVAFWDSLVNLWQTTLAGGLIGYMWMVPIAAALAALGIVYRGRAELPIHDRQTDVIVGIIGLGLALMVQGVLLKRYSDFFYLLRLDIFAMGVFILSSALVLFGIRPVARFGWVWLLFGLSSALPYQVVVIVLGGGRFAAAAATLVIAAAAAAIAMGRPRRRAIFGAGATFVLGLVIVGVMAVVAREAPVFAYQMIPSLLSLVMVLGAAYGYSRRRHETKGLFARLVEPLAARQIWAAVPLVIAVGVALALMPLPALTTTTKISRAAPFDLVPGRALVAPPGWSITDEHTAVGVSRYYGDDARLVRQRMTADIGDPRFDKLAAPRTLMVDSIVSELPFSFDAYPGQVLYDTTAARLSAPRLVDLGHGVSAKLISAVDDRLLVTWDLLRFAWGDKEREQIIDIFAVDNHRPDAPFPDPQRGLAATLRNLLTVLFRGNAVLIQSRPSFKDEELLLEFGRAFVTAQFENTGAAR